MECWVCLQEIETIANECHPLCDECFRIYENQCPHPYHQSLVPQIECPQPKWFFSLLSSDWKSILWLKQYTIQCPRCQRRIFRDGGCSHMLCWCGTSLCFDCESLWGECKCWRIRRTVNTIQNRSFSPKVFIYGATTCIALFFMSRKFRP